MTISVDLRAPVADVAHAGLFAPFFPRLAEERLAVAYLDGTGGVIDLHLSQGSAAAIDFPLRRIVQSALVTDAAAIMLAHNHPSGDTRPSLADREMTRKLAVALRPLDIRLLDHLIFGGGRPCSFRALGLL